MMKFAKFVGASLAGARIVSARLKANVRVGASLAGARIVAARVRRPHPPLTLPPNSPILVIKLAGIGDLLLATPTLRALRETYPQARIDLLVTPDSAGLLNGWDIIDHIIVLNKYLFDHPQQLLKNPRNLLQLASLYYKLRTGHYHTVLLLHHLTLPFGRLKHQLLLRATGARWRVGLDNGHGWFLNVRVKDSGFGAMHEAEYNLAVAEAVGATTSNKRLTVPISDADYAQAWQERPLRLPLREHESANTRPIIAMHPGSGRYSTARRWAPERFAQLADTLFHDVGGQLLLLGGPEEAELHQHIMSMMQSAMPVYSLAGKGSINVTAAVLEQVDLFIGNDSALVHVAVAVGTPTVAIFGLTNHKAWGPFTNAQATVVHLDLPCMPCFYRSHDLGTPQGCATRDCLALLGIDPVAVAARKLLQGSQQGGS